MGPFEKEKPADIFQAYQLREKVPREKMNPQKPGQRPLGRVVSVHTFGTHPKQSLPTG